MSRTIRVISKEGTSIELSEEVANTTKYLETVLKEDPSVTEITTNIPLNALEIAKKFCRILLGESCVSRVPLTQTHGTNPKAAHRQPELSQ